MGTNYPGGDVMNQSLWRKKRWGPESLAQRRTIFTKDLDWENIHGRLLWIETFWVIWIKLLFLWVLQRRTHPGSSFEQCCSTCQGPCRICQTSSWKGGSVFTTWRSNVHVRSSCQSHPLVWNLLRMFYPMYSASFLPKCSYLGSCLIWLYGSRCKDQSQAVLVALQQRKNQVQILGSRFEGAASRIFLGISILRSDLHCWPQYD